MIWIDFLPILGGQKAAMSDSVEGWCAAGNLGASKVSIRMDDRTDGRMDDEIDGWWDRWMKWCFTSQRPLLYVILSKPLLEEIPMWHATLHSYLLATHLKVQVFQELSTSVFLFWGKFFDGNPHMILILGQKLLKVTIFWEEKTEITIFRQQFGSVAKNVVGVVNFSNVLLYL